MTPTFKAREGQTPLTFLYEKLAERCMGAPLPSFASTWHMENGQILEAEARGFAAVTFDANIERVGFITDDACRIGASPDGLLGEDGGLELKCCAAQTHVRYMVEGVLPEEHKCQVHGALYVSGRKFWQFGSYARGFPFFHVRVERDEARAWVRRLTAAERVLTCAFCGEAYPPGTPESNHEALTEHVRVCTKHPMREAEAEIARLRQEIQDLRTYDREL